MDKEIYKKRILIVDDMPENIDILVNALSEYSNIMVATSGQRALDIVHSENVPDIILLDIVMEGMDGYEECRKIREEKKYNNVSVIFITGQKDIENEMKGLKLGASDYIIKPINTEILKLRIKNQLQLKIVKERLQEQNRSLEERVMKRTEKLLEAMKRAKQANAAKSELMSNLSHELRTPLSGMFGSLEMLKELNEDEHKAKIYDLQMDSSKKLLNLIENLLTFQVLEENRFHIEEDEIDIEEIIENIYKVHKKEIENKVWKFVMQTKIEKSKKIFGSKLAIDTIIFNLLSNAIKFTLKGEIKLIFDLEDGNLIITCEDTGIGIEEKKIKDIYKSFTQGEYYISKKYGGLGIGLNIIVNILEKVGGDINLESKKGKGTKIEIKIPVKTT